MKVSGDRSALGSALSILLFGLIVALIWTFLIFPRFSPINQVFDLNGFGEIGEHIARGDGFSLGHGPTLRRAPLYPFLVSVMLRLFGFDPANQPASYIPVLVLQCLFHGLTCAAVFCIGRRLFGGRVALWAGVLCALWPQCLRYVGAIDVEATMTLLLTLMTLAAVRFWQQTDWRNGAVLGVVAGLAALVKPVPLLYPFLLIALLVFRARRNRLPMPVVPCLACIAALVLVCVPWMVRNHLVSGGRFNGLSSNASGEFLRGFVVARSDYAGLRKRFQGNWDWDANLYEEAILSRAGLSFFSYENGKQVRMYETVDNELRKEQVENRAAKDLVRQRPLALVRKFVIQVFTFWYIVETPLKSVLVGLFSLSALALAAIGWRRARADSVDVAPVVAVVLYFNIVYALLLALARYSMPVFPSLLVLSANGLYALVAARKSAGERELRAEKDIEAPAGV